MEMIIKQLTKISTIRILFILFILNLGLFYLPGTPGNITENTQKMQMPDMQGVYSAQDVHQFLTAIGQEGRESYQMMHLTIDMIFPLIYGLLFTGALAYLSARVKKPPRKMLQYLGLAAAGFDLLENFFLLYITGTYPALQIRATAAAQLFSLAKFSFFAASILTILILAVKWLRRRSGQEPNQA